MTIYSFTVLYNVAIWAVHWHTCSFILCPELRSVLFTMQRTRNILRHRHSLKPCQNGKRSSLKNRNILKCGISKSVVVCRIVCNATHHFRSCTITANTTLCIDLHHRLWLAQSGSLCRPLYEASITHLLECMWYILVYVTH